MIAGRYGPSISHPVMMKATVIVLCMEKRLLMQILELGARKQIRDLIHPDRQKHVPSERNRTTQLLCHLTASSASVASDKIFAIHELMKVLGVSLPPPDYRLPTSEVYWKACCALMTNQNSLETLGIVNSSADFKDVPSWVPDFSRKSPRWEMNSAWFHASGDKSNPIFHLADSDRVLVTKAKVLDTIKGKTERLVSSTLQSLHTDNDPLFANSLPTVLDAIEVLQGWIEAALKLRPNGALVCHILLLAYLQLVYEACEKRLQLPRSNPQWHASQHTPPEQTLTSRGRC